jgi:hypothetical protein
MLLTLHYRLLALEQQSTVLTMDMIIVLPPEAVQSGICSVYA